MFEAMATARPIVLGVLGESARLVRYAQAGLVVEPEDPRALAEALVDLAADPQMANAMGEHGRRFVEDELDRDKLAATMLEELRTVVA